MQILVLSALCKCLEYRFDAESKILYQFVLFSSLNRRCYTHVTQHTHHATLWKSPAFAEDMLPHFFALPDCSVFLLNTVRTFLSLYLMPWLLDLTNTYTGTAHIFP